MGYCKIVRYADVVELFEYEKEKHVKPRLYTKKRIAILTGERSIRQKQISTFSFLQEDIKRKKTHRKKKIYFRSDSSIRRARTNFFRMCYCNCYSAKTVTFVTLTFAYDIEFQEANRSVKRFFERIKKRFIKSSISYISVHEKTKKNRLHYHLLVFNLPTKEIKQERVTRYFQRQFNRGYVDIRLADRITEGIAGYMAKYLSKTLNDTSYSTRKGYTCSRNIEKITVHGSNSLSYYMGHFVDNPMDIQTQSKYNVPYMGICSYKKIKIKK